MICGKLAIIKGHHILANNEVTIKTKVGLTILFVQIFWLLIPYDFLLGTGTGRVPFTWKFYDSVQGRVKAGSQSDLTVLCFFLTF